MRLFPSPISARASILAPFLCAALNSQAESDGRYRYVTEETEDRIIVRQIPAVPCEMNFVLRREHAAEFPLPTKIKDMANSITFLLPISCAYAMTTKAGTRVSSLYISDIYDSEAVMPTSWTLRTGTPEKIPDFPEMTSCGITLGFQLTDHFSNLFEKSEPFSNFQEPYGLIKLNVPCSTHDQIVLGKEIVPVSLPGIVIDEGELRGLHVITLSKHGRSPEPTAAP